MNRTATATASTTWDYYYNGAGERVAKYQTAPGWSYTFRDESDRVAGKFAATSPSIDNIFLGSQVVASYANGGVSGNDHVWAFFTSDHLGTPRFLTDATGVTFETRKYWPYGEQAIGTGSLEHLRFATMERDAEAGTGNDRYFDHARYHGSGLGRFLSPDRLGGKALGPQTWNRYAYARNNPVGLVDPDGRQSADLNSRDLNMLYLNKQISYDELARRTIEITPGHIVALGALSLFTAPATIPAWLTLVSFGGAVTMGAIGSPSNRMLGAAIAGLFGLFPGAGPGAVLFRGMAGNAGAQEVTEGKVDLKRVIAAGFASGAASLEIVGAGAAGASEVASPLLEQLNSAIATAVDRGLQKEDVPQPGAAPLNQCPNGGSPHSNGDNVRIRARRSWAREALR